MLTQSGVLLPWEPWKEREAWTGKTWTPWAGPSSETLIAEVRAGSVAVWGDGGDLVEEFHHTDPVIARHRAECFVLGEEAWV